MSFASDSFNGSSNQELSAYSASWSKQSGYTANGNIGLTAQTYCFSADSSTYAVYQNSASPASADYSVFADCKNTNTTQASQYGPCGRMQSGASTFYLAMYRLAFGQIRMYKFVAGAATQLGSSHSFTTTANQVYNIELRMAGTAISTYLDTVSIISATDSGITVAGKAGLLLFGMRETGVDDRCRVEEFYANDAGGSAAPPVRMLFKRQAVNRAASY